MDMSKARPSERIRFQQDVIRQQDELIDLLKGALAAAGLHMEGKPEPWLSELTTQERALVGALFARFPRVVDRYDLLDSLPGYSNAEDRQVQILNVLFTGSGASSAKTQSIRRVVKGSAWVIDSMLS